MMENIFIKKIKERLEAEPDLLDQLPADVQAAVQNDGIIEVPAPTPEELQQQYETLVAQKVRAKYTNSQEFAILRQKEEKPAEYLDYYNFCETCKAEARTEIFPEE